MISIFVSLFINIVLLLYTIISQKNIEFNIKFPTIHIKIPTFRRKRAKKPTDIIMQKSANIIIQLVEHKTFYKLAYPVFGIQLNYKIISNNEINITTKEYDNILQSIINNYQFGKEDAENFTGILSYFDNNTKRMKISRNHLEFEKILTDSYNNYGKLPSVLNCSIQSPGRWINWYIYYNNNEQWRQLDDGIPIVIEMPKKISKNDYYFFKKQFQKMIKKKRKQNKKKGRVVVTDDWGYFDKNKQAKPFSGFEQFKSVFKNSNIKTNNFISYVKVFKN